MFYLIGYGLFIIVELVAAISLCIFAFSMLFSSIKGAPYVPTRKKEILNFLNEVVFKKGKLFLELGCGDGRVVRTAVKEFGVKGLGVDVNPVLILWARILSKLTKTPHTEFKVENILKTDFSKADYIYLFLMPELIVKIEEKLKKETKKNAILISHGFRIIGLEKYRYHTLHHKPFPTYYYRMK